MTRRTEVAIVGGGLMGAWTAFFLRRRRRAVTLFEKDAVGAQASGQNYGNLRLQGRHPSQMPLVLRAHAHWDTLEELVGSSCELVRSGHSLDLPDGLGREEAVRWNARFEEESGLVVEPDGRARYTGRLRAALRSIDPVLADGFSLADLEAAHAVMHELRERLSAEP